MSLWKRRQVQPMDWSQKFSEVSNFSFLIYFYTIFVFRWSLSDCSHASCSVGVVVPCRWVMSGLHLRWPLRWRCMSVILPQFLVQQQEILFFLSWLTAVVWFFNYKVPLSSPSCKDFNRAWTQCLHSAPPQRVLCVGSQACWLHPMWGVATAFRPVISTLL